MSKPPLICIRCLLVVLPTWLVMTSSFLRASPRIIVCRNLFFQERKWFPFRQCRYWSISSFKGIPLVCHFQTFVLLTRKSQMRYMPDLGKYWSWWCWISPSFWLLPRLGELVEAQYVPEHPHLAICCLQDSCWMISFLLEERWRCHTQWLCKVLYVLN